jgi:hypothetical protein
MAEASSGSHNGGICVRMASSLSVTRCTFAECEHHSAETNAAAVLLVYECPPLAHIEQADFVNNVPDSAHTLTVVSGGQLTITQCCFTGTRTAEIGKFVAVEKCVFEQPFCPPLPLWEGRHGREVGFDSAATVGPMQGISDDPVAGAFAPPTVAAVVATSAACAAVGAAVLTGVQVSFQKWRARMKRPHALI